MSEERLPNLDAPAAAMRLPQLRAALRRLQRAYSDGALDGELYIRLVGHLITEHPPNAVIERRRGQQ